MSTQPQQNKVLAKPGHVLGSSQVPEKPSTHPSIHPSIRSSICHPSMCADQVVESTTANHHHRELDQSPLATTTDKTLSLQHEQRQLPAGPGDRSSPTLHFSLLIGKIASLLPSTSLNTWIDTCLLILSMRAHSRPLRRRRARH